MDGSREGDCMVEHQNRQICVVLPEVELPIRMHDDLLDVSVLRGLLELILQTVTTKQNSDLFRFQLLLDVLILNAMGGWKYLLEITLIYGFAIIPVNTCLLEIKVPPQKN